MGTKAVVVKCRRQCARLPLQHEMQLTLAGVTGSQEQGLFLVATERITEVYSLVAFLCNVAPCNIAVEQYVTWRPEFDA